MIVCRFNLDMEGPGVHEEINRIFTLENSASEAIPPNKNLPAVSASAYCCFTPQSTFMLKFSSVGVEINF